MDLKKAKFVRNPKRPYELLLEVDGQPISHGPIEITSDPKNFTTVKVTFFQFDLLGETFPENLTISRERLAIDAAEEQGLISNEEATRQRIELASRA